MPPSAAQPKGQQGPEATTSSNRRSQPARQARTNPNKSSAAKPDSPMAGPRGDQPADSFPAVTHFADILTALPKEVVRHLTLFKEVDAKIYNPEKELFRLIKQAHDLPEISSSAATMPQTSAADAGTRSSNAGPDPFDSSNNSRRQLYRQITMKLQSMIGSLEEKNHVVTAANITLDKQLARIADVFPHVQNEFSEEAKYGNPNHWAYPENRTGGNSSGGNANSNGGKSGQGERSRRDGVAAISAAAQALVDEAAARSDARKQAVQAKKNLKAQQQQHHHQGADAEVAPTKAAKGEPQKKTSGPAKARKPVPDAAPSTTSATPASGNPPKRRKIEKPTPKAAAATTATATADVGARIATQPVLSVPADKEKEKDSEKEKEADKMPADPMVEQAGQNNPEPVAPPAEAEHTTVAAKESTKKRKAPAAGVRSKSRAAASQPPSPRQQSVVPERVVAEPVSTVVEPAPQPAPASAPPLSPKPNVPAVAPVPESQEVAQPAVPEPADADTMMTDAPPPLAADVPPAPTETSLPVAPAVSDVLPTTETAAPVGPEEVEEPKAVEPSPVATPAQPVIPKKEHPIIRVEERPPKSESPSTATVAAHVTTTKSGRASKPSTPSIATFQEATRPREKAKKSHKKGATAAASQAVENPQDNPNEEEAEEDANEPRYCYCRDFSHGEMVGCDGPDCKGQWFHISCIGLRAAPRGNAKWYCADCKEERAKLNKRTTGR